MLKLDAAAMERALTKARRRRELPAPLMRRAIREHAKLAQFDVARAIGVTRVAVSRYEAGTRDPRDPNVIERYVSLLSRLATESAR